MFVTAMGEMGNLVIVALRGNGDWNGWEFTS